MNNYIIWEFMNFTSDFIISVWKTGKCSVIHSLHISEEQRQTSNSWTLKVFQFRFDFHHCASIKVTNTGHVSLQALVHLKFSSLKNPPVLCIEQWTSLPLSGLKSCCKSLTNQCSQIQSSFDTNPQIPRSFFLHHIIQLTAFCSILTSLCVWSSN